MRSLALPVLAVILVAGCLQPPDNPDRRQQAVELADRYLHALVGGEPDRGWSLLHPTARDEWGSEAAYVGAADGADWSQFDFSVREALYCDDGIICPVALDLPGGRESIPHAFRSPDGRDSIGIVFREVEDLPGNAELTVVLPDFLRGAGGVSPAGG
jgi:hypothetical protein